MDAQHSPRLLDDVGADEEPVEAQTLATHEVISPPRQHRNERRDARAGEIRVPADPLGGEVPGVWHRQCPVRSDDVLRTRGVGFSIHASHLHCTSIINETKPPFHSSVFFSSSSLTHLYIQYHAYV